MAVDEQRLVVLERQVSALRREIQRLSGELEVLQTSPLKRWFWFVPQGW